MAPEMDPDERARCDAPTRAGRPCRNPPVRGGRCLLHALSHAPAADPLDALLGEEDRALLVLLAEGDGLTLLQRLAELRALKAHRASLEDAGSNTLDQIFARNLHAAEVILRARLRLAEAEADGTAPGTRSEEPIAPDDPDRRQRLTDLLDRLRARQTDRAAGNRPARPTEPK
jgi:hypothetical protein